MAAQEFAKETGRTGGDAPVRQCALTRERHSADRLIRFALGPDHQVTPDLKQRLPGRGVWLLPTRETVERAVQRKVFPRSFGAPAATPDGLPDLIDKLLAKSALEALSLANKAGQAVFGFAKVEEAIGSGRVLGLMHASDASADGARKLDGKLNAKKSGSLVMPLRLFTTAELDLVTGRSNVVHAALIQGGAAERFLAAAGRLSRYRASAEDVVLLPGVEPDRR